MGDKPRLLLTGGEGMVGRNVLTHAAAKEWKIFAPTRTELDLLESKAVEKYIALTKPDCVIHAAGRVGGIHANMANPVAFLDDNALMGRNVVMSAWKGGVRNLINLASTCIYPRDAENPLREDSILSGPLEPTNEGYALAKILVMRLCEFIRYEDQGAQYKTLIPCNLYGLYDNFDPEKSHLVPAIINKVHYARKSGAKRIEIWGDGTARREFMFAGDLADAIWNALKDISNLPNVMNIGVGLDYSVNEYYATIADVIGWEGKFIHDLTKPTGMKQKLCAVEKQTAWGWKPSTALEEGIAQTYEYYLENIKA